MNSITLTGRLTRDPELRTTRSASSVTQFRNLTVDRAAAAELPAINLEDALPTCLLVRKHESRHFERAALRWIGRYCLERQGAPVYITTVAATLLDSAQRPRFRVLAFRNLHYRALFQRAAAWPLGPRPEQSRRDYELPQVQI